MAITTMDGLVAGLGGAQRLVVNKANVVAVAGRTMSLWTATGQPGAGEATAGITSSGVVPTLSTVGALSFVNPVSGSNSYLAGVRGFSAATGMIILYDVLWQWTSGTGGWSVTTTTSQSLSGGFPGLTRPDASGTNTELWLESLTVGGATNGSTLSVTYTNSAATPATAQTASIGAMISAPPVGTIQPLTLTAGDNGVKAVSALSHSATWTSGTYRLMIVRRLAEIPCTALTAFSYNAVDLGMPRIYDNACLGMAFSANSTATGPLMMSLSLAQG